MKKIIVGLLLTISFLLPTSFIAARGGGAFFGSMAGGLVAGAMNKDNSGRRAEEKVDAMTRERRLDQYVNQKSSFNLLIVVLIIMFLAIIGLGFIIFKKNKK